MNEQPLTRALGALSLGLGVSGLVAPGPVANLSGVGDGPRSRLVLRLVGAREVACGVGILTQRRPTGWVWARVASDAMDLSMTSVALASTSWRKDNRRLLATLAALLGITAGDVYAAIQLSRSKDTTASGGARVKRAVTVLRSPDECYSYWHDFTTLPRFMEHLESVQMLGGARSHWRAKGPAGTSVEWDAEIVEDQPNSRIAWRSLPGATVPNAGTVRFVPAPGGRGTEVHVELHYDPPAGQLGSVAAMLFGEEPSQQVRDDLGRFKQILETGQVTLSAPAVKGFGSGEPPEKAPPAEASRRPEPAVH